MRLTMKERQSVTAVVAVRYRKAGKKDKKQILDEFRRAVAQTYFLSINKKFSTSNSI